MLYGNPLELHKCLRILRVLTLTHSNKKDIGKSQSLFYGASNGLNFEPGVNDIVKFAHLCLHDKETIEEVKSLLD